MGARSVGSASLVRLLGGWRDEARAAAGGDPLYVQLASAIRLLVLDGRLGVDVRVPGERELAAALGVSRTTVSSAFARLRDQGHLVSRHGAGSRTSLPGGATARVASGLLPGGGADALIDFGAAALPADPGVHAAYARALEQLPAHLPGHGYEPLGLPLLREEIAARYAARGVPTAPEQVLVTSGAQHALVLVLQHLVGPGDRVQVDHPTYPHAIDAILRASARPVPVGMPDDGWDVEGMIAAMRQSAPRAVYLIADFHNPTGRVMGDEDRRRVVEAAALARTTVIADETMADLALDAPVPAPVATHDEGAGVLTLGSMSKSAWGGLRVGWIRGSAAAIAALGAARPALDLGTPVVEQLAAAGLLADDARRLPPRRAMLRERRDVLVQALHETLPDWRFAVAPGGNSLWVELPAPASSALTGAAERHGVRLVPGPRFGVDGSFERFLRIPFTAEPGLLREATARLAAAWGDLRLADEPATTGADARTVALV